MPVVVIAPPADVLTLQECKDQLGVRHNDDDALIARIARGAVQLLAAPAGWLGRSLGIQTLELRLAEFSPPWQPIHLPFPPVVSVESVKYTDPDGVEQTVPPDAYQLIGDPTNCALLTLAFGKSWPAIRRDPEPVRIRYTAGYAQLPGPILDALLLLVTHRYENRSAVSDTAKALLPMAVDDALAPFRIW